jgi:uncharacterized protein (DUF4415 family)
MPRPLADKDGEVRELTAEDMRLFKPIAEIDPAMVGAMKEFRRKLGRPKAETPKVHIGFRLAADIVESIKASGRGYNARVEQALREAGFGAMALNQRGEYLSLRREFEPTRVTLAIIAESPPISGKYFYDPAGDKSEPLFSALMKVLGIRPKTKLEGLREFSEAGWVLVDATYEPVNARDKRRDRVINRDYPELVSDLRRLLGGCWSEIPLILIKANVCRLLEPKLKDSGFNVLNKGRIVPFPSTGHQLDFERQFREILPRTV